MFSVIRTYNKIHNYILCGTYISSTYLPSFLHKATLIFSHALCLSTRDTVIRLFEAEVDRGGGGGGGLKMLTVNPNTKSFDCSIVCRNSMCIFQLILCCGFQFRSNITYPVRAAQL